MIATKFDIRRHELIKLAIWADDSPPKRFFYRRKDPGLDVCRTVCLTYKDRPIGTATVAGVRSFASSSWEISLAAPTLTIDLKKV